MGSLRFEVIPALDLRGGRLARMPGGDPTALVELPGDPVAVAERFAGAGAAWVHVVDLDAAIDGVPRNLDVMARIARLPVRVQAGGGLSPEGVELALDRGAARAILGAAALSDPEVVREAVARHGPRVGVAVDVRGGVVAPRGTSRTGPPAEEALALLSQVRPAFLVYTDVEADGRPTGPDLAALERAAGRAGVPVLASGGIRSIEDIRRVAALWPAVTGAIVGRALHQGTLVLAEALAAVSRPERSGMGESAPGAT